MSPEKVRFYILYVKTLENPMPLSFYKILKENFCFGIKESKKTVDYLLENKETIVTIRGTLSTINKIKSESTRGGFNCRIEDIFDL